MRSQDTSGRNMWKFFDASMQSPAPDFLGEAKVQHANMISALAGMRRMNELVHKWDTIWPDQCDYIASTLQRIRLPVYDFVVLLSQTSRLPLSIIVPNYSVVAELNYFELQIQRLLTFLAPFRSTRHMRSCLLYSQQLEVLQYIEKIMCDGDAINRQLDILLDALELQE